MASKDKRANGAAVDDAEFEKLLDEMDELGRQADALRAKVNYLIDEMRENDVQPDEEADGIASDVDNAADQAAVNEEAGHTSSEGEEEENEAGDGDVALEADHEPDAT